MAVKPSVVPTARRPQLVAETPMLIPPARHILSLRISPGGGIFTWFVAREDGYEGVNVSGGTMATAHRVGFREGGAVLSVRTGQERATDTRRVNRSGLETGAVLMMMSSHSAKKPPTV
ncbi:unnamed protein product [Pleuronectes platessa]|uniref:Uncharacterized protein n=1 Tax=Pleuronectes platessa TaxID=8262 RepID=A0A9N7YH69_PLEPL|nr:unnamed protein product [Pleuronectes platessa]